MGCSASVISCPKCGRTGFANSHQLVEHLKQQHAFGATNAPVAVPRPSSVAPCKFCRQNVHIDELVDHLQALHIKPPPPTIQLLTCPTCGRNDLPNGQVLLDHMKIFHGLTDQLQDIPPPPTPKQPCRCPNCGAEMMAEEMVEHLQKMHINCVDNTISCPKCSKNDITSGEEFLEHLKSEHAFSPASKVENTITVDDPVHGQKKLPQVGDKVLGMWSESKWQYFHATIVRFMADSLRYEIDWDDGDTTGRFVDYHNIALDKVPEENEIGIGSTILFPQADYTAGQTQLTGGKRWHQGQITKIYKHNNKRYYDGIHTKGNKDGKYVTYKGYSYNFTGYLREQFRVGPNVFDILDDTGEEGVSMDDVDIYFSCSKPDSVSGDMSSEDYNPIQLSEKLKDKGLKVVDGGQNGTARNNLMEKVNLMRNSKVFIACISDEYVANEQCRMEFQYAKSTLRKPVIPVVIGNGTEWNMSVVGMLIAGELYIHFKDQSSEEVKLQEVLRTLSVHISRLTEAIDKQEEADVKVGPGDIFISYCWSNSWDAKMKDQISEHSGTTYADPRAISRKIFDLGYKTWLDIERLKSADQNAGLYEQLTEALKQAKLVVPCISDEYARSVNCQMEFKFAVNSLRKPVLPVVVGTGNEWSKTVIGALLTSNNMEPIDFQLTGDEASFEEKFSSLVEKIKTAVTLEVTEKELDSEEEPSAPAAQRSRAPQVGDHVVCHHFNYCYYMATVVSFNRATMQYTVAWDDGDKSGTVQKFNQVARDVAPNEYDIGVGSTIFFPQGTYVGTEGSNDGGVRYHEGVVTGINREGNVTVDGHHTRGVDDNKRCTYRGYSHEFYGIPMYDLRLAPTALESFSI